MGSFWRYLLLPKTPFSPYKGTQNMEDEINYTFRGLSLTQEKAARIIAEGKKISNKKVAIAVGVKISSIKEWKRNSMFKVRVIQLFDDMLDLERTTRVAKLTKLLSPIYKEVSKRVKDGSLEAMPFKELIILMAKIHSEIRLDSSSNQRFLTPGPGNKNSDFGKRQLSQGVGGDMLAEMNESYEGIRRDGIGDGSEPPKVSPTIQ